MDYTLLNSVNVFSFFFPFSVVSFHQSLAVRELIEKNKVEAPFSIKSEILDMVPKK